MDNTDILNYIRDNYIYWYDLPEKQRNEFMNINKGEDFFELLSEKLQDFHDPHVKIKQQNNKIFILPICIGIIENSLVILEDNPHYPMIKKGNKLISIDNISLDDLLLANEKMWSNTLRLMRILGQLAYSDSEKLVNLTFIDVNKTTISVSVRYCNFLNQSMKEQSMQQLIEIEKNFRQNIRTEHNIAYYKFPCLMSSTEVEKFIDDIKKEEQDKILIDIRNNMGGRIEFAKKITELFISHTKVIRWKSRHETGEIILESNSEALNLKNKKIVVLFNNLTCSCSEYIFLRSLSSEKNIKLIGNDSCGMKDIAKVIKLPQKRVLSLTVKKYVDDKECDIEIKNIKPDIFVQNSIGNMIKNRDYELEKSIEYLKKM